MRRLVAALICATASACAHAVKHDAPERLAAAQHALDEAATHAVTVDVDAALGDDNRSDAVVAGLMEAFAEAIDRYDPASAAACKGAACPASYRTGVEANALELVRAVRYIRFYPAPAKPRRATFDPATGTLAIPWPAHTSLDRLHAGADIDTVIVSTLARAFTGRSPTQIEDADLPRYVLFLASQPCGIGPLTAVYARLGKATLEYSREVLTSAADNPACKADNRDRAAWATWFSVHSGDLGDEQLRTASRAVLVPATTGNVGESPPADLPNLPALKYAIAVFKRAVSDPDTREARVLACTGKGRCVSPLVDFFTTDATNLRRRALARALVAGSPSLASVVCNALFTARGVFVWRTDFLERLTENPSVWSASLAVAWRADASGIADTLVTMWQSHPPLQTELIRASVAASHDTSAEAQRDIARDVVRVAVTACHANIDSNFFTILKSAAPADSVVATEVAQYGSSCREVVAHP